MLTSTTLMYRRDVQGLRAIAVIAVLLYHFSPGQFTFGYLGVDMFAVISGYVVSTVVLREVRNTASFNIRRFAIRRARRLMPVLMFVLAVIVLTWLVVAPVDSHGDLLRAAISAIGLGANFFFFQKSTDYFSDDNSPLIHLWSLSMEEQFYFMLMLGVSGLLVIRRVMPNVKKIAISRSLLLVFSILSLVIVAWLSTKMASSDSSKVENFLFFFPLGRIWQFLAGAAIAVSENRERNSKNLIRLFYWLVQVFAVLLILVLLIDQESENQFVSWQRVVVTFSTAAVILFNTNLPEGWLTSAPLVAIGDRSYSLYLWHVPVMSVWETMTGSRIGFLVYGVSLVVLTELSYRIFELPFRSTGQPRNLHRRAIQCALAGVILAVPIVESGLVGSTILAMEPTLKLRLGSDGGSNFANEVGHSECSDSTGVYVCGQFNETVDVVLIGDSHAMAMSHVFVEVARNLGLNPFVRAQPGCRILFSSGWISGSETTNSLSQCETSMREFALELRKFKPVIFIAECPTRPTYGCPDVELLEASEAFLKVREENVLKLNDYSRKVVLIQELPFVKDRFGKPSLIQTLLNSNEIMQFGVQSDIESYLSFFRTDLERIANKYSQFTSVYEPSDVLCSSESCVATDAEGRPVWVDSDHLTVYGANLLKPTLRAVMHEVVLVSSP